MTDVLQIGLVARRGNDAQVQAMRDVYLACDKAGVPVPQAVQDFFGGEHPDRLIDQAVPAQARTFTHNGAQVYVVDIAPDGSVAQVVVTVPQGSTARDLDPRYGRMRQIKDRLVAHLYPCRYDMHEPDEQGVSAVVRGNHLDNAMGATADYDSGEFAVGLTRELHDGTAATEWFNLADILALARLAKIG